MQPAQAIVAAGSVASAATIVAQSAVNDGIDPTTGWAGGLVGAGVAVFVYMDRRAQRERDNMLDERRRDDEERSRRMRQLEEENARLHQQIIDILRSRLDDN